MINDNAKIKLIFDEAYKFLIKKVEEEEIKKHIKHYKKYKPTSISEIFNKMVSTLTNKQGYRNFVAYPEEVKDILFNFNPKRLLERVTDWKQLFNIFKKKFGYKYKMEIEKKNNAWVLYTKGVLSCAHFISNFKDYEEFDNFITSFFSYEFTTVALPMVLEKEIFGFGFPLACDFLKEIGYTQYAKPDVHIKDILNSLKLIDSRKDYDVFKKIIKISKILKKDPVEVDKIFWLIGSGKFHLSTPPIDIGSQKEAFLKYIKTKYPDFF